MWYTFFQSVGKVVLNWPVQSLWLVYSLPCVLNISKKGIFPKVFEKLLLNHFIHIKENFPKVLEKLWFSRFVYFVYPSNPYPGRVYQRKRIFQKRKKLCLSRFEFLPEYLHSPCPSFKIPSKCELCLMSSVFRLVNDPQVFIILIV